MNLNEAVAKALAILQERLENPKRLCVDLTGDGGACVHLSGSDFRRVLAGQAVTLEPRATSNDWYDAFGEVDGVKFESYLFERIAPPPLPPVKTIILPALEPVAVEADD